MSYKSLSELQKHMEIETIKELSPEQINKVLTKLHSQNVELCNKLEDSICLAGLSEVSKHCIKMYVNAKFRKEKKHGIN